MFDVLVESVCCDLNDIFHHLSVGREGRTDEKYGEREVGRKLDRID